MTSDEVQRLADTYAFFCPDPFWFPVTPRYDQARPDGRQTLSVRRCPGEAWQTLQRMKALLCVSDEFVAGFGFVSAVQLPFPQTSTCSFGTHLLTGWLNDSEIRASLPELHSMTPEDLVALLEKCLCMPWFFSQNEFGTLFYVENYNGDTVPVTLRPTCRDDNNETSHSWFLDIETDSQDKRRPIGTQLMYRIQ